MHRQLEQVATYQTIRLAFRLILLTLVRKSELSEAVWDEVDFEAAVWTIPKSRMKARKAHNVYLSRQAQDIMVALHTCAAGSRYVLPSRYDADRCMSRATLNRVTQLVVARAQTAGLSLEPFTKTGSSEKGFCTASPATGGRAQLFAVPTVSVVSRVITTGYLKPLRGFISWSS